MLLYGPSGSLYPLQILPDVLVFFVQQPKLGREFIHVDLHA